MDKFIKELIRSQRFQDEAGVLRGLDKICRGFFEVNKTSFIRKVRITSMILIISAIYT
jgi:hypothetical protein